MRWAFRTLVTRSFSTIRLMSVRSNTARAPGSNRWAPGSFALSLDTDSQGCVVIAGDAVKYAKEALLKKCDMAFDSVAAGTSSINRILDMADRIIPGHFPELIKRDGTFVWEDTAELALIVR